MSGRDDDYDDGDGSPIKSLPNPTTTNFPLTTWNLHKNAIFFISTPATATLMIISLSQNNHHHYPSNPQTLIALTSPKPMNSILISKQSQLDLALTQIKELKAEIEFERRMRKKAESSKKRLERELQDERERREATDRVCEELAKEIAADKAEMDRMKEEMEEEKKMWRVAEVWREERVRMKMAEARILMEEKVVELSKGRDQADERRGQEEDTLGISGFFMGSNCSKQVQARSKSQRNGSPEAENPHIRRGIKGFVEFPKVIRAVGLRGRQLGSKLECQKAQLRLFLRQKNAVGLGFGRPSSSNLLVGG